MSERFEPAPDRAAAARGLGRVCRVDGRLGLTVWRPFVGMHALCELQIRPQIWLLETESPDAHYERLTMSVPPLAAFMRRLLPARVREGCDYLLVLGRRRR